MAKIDLKFYPFLNQLSGKTMEGGTHVCPTGFTQSYRLYACRNKKNIIMTTNYREMLQWISVSCW